LKTFAEHGRDIIYQIKIFKDHDSEIITNPKAMANLLATETSSDGQHTQAFRKRKAEKNTQITINPIIAL
jgi:hypothetical protein